MPWKESDTVDQRQKFALEAMAGNIDFSELCRKYGISRKTGYKWKERFLQKGINGLEDGSRRPKKSPTSVAEDVVCELVKFKIAHPTWGPKKIRDLYARNNPGKEIPCETSVKRILGRAGLVEHRKRRQSTDGGRITNRVEAERANHIWTVDFKGWWYTNNGKRFEPLTICDSYSRYVLCATALDNGRVDSVRAAFEELFRSHGLPEIIRSDNGSPFACYHSPLGLTQLSAWWVALGISLDRIPPGRPDQNGSHERMHRDIKREVQRNAADSIASQQADLDIWRTIYNYERPHEALGMQLPAELYEKSTRSYHENIEIAYPIGFESRTVNGCGIIGLRSKRILISRALRGWNLGLKEISSTVYEAWFCDLRLGEIDVLTEKLKVFKPTSK